MYCYYYYITSVYYSRVLYSKTSGAINLTFGRVLKRLLRNYKEIIFLVLHLLLMIPDVLSYLCVYLYIYIRMYTVLITCEYLTFGILPLLSKTRDISSRVCSNHVACATWLLQTLEDMFIEEFMPQKSGLSKLWIIWVVYIDTEFR